MSPLLFGLFIDRFESFVAERAAAAGVDLGGRLLRMLLYADDMVLLASSAADLQRLLDVLHEFCVENKLEVNVRKTEVVVFGRRRWRPSNPFTWSYNSQAIPRADSFKYLGVVMHTTRGLNMASDSLRSAGLRAMWAMQVRFKQRDIVDFSMRCRLYRILTQPILNYCSEVWAPGLLLDLNKALHAPLQVIQNDFLRAMGGLKKRTPADLLARESGLSPISRMWVNACCKLWNRLIGSEDGWVRRAFIDDLELTKSLATDENPLNKHVWCGAWVTALLWLAEAGTVSMRDYVTRALAVVEAGGAGVASLQQLPVQGVLDAFDKALSSYSSNIHQRSSISCPVIAAYESSYALLPSNHFQENGFPDDMPYYFRHTSRFYNHQHARALMRVRCVSTPFAACPSSFERDRSCRHCSQTGGAELPPDESMEHLVFDCPDHDTVRAEPRFARLFQHVSIPAGRLRTFIHQPNQHGVASFLHCILERHQAVRWPAHAGA